VVAVARQIAIQPLSNVIVVELLAPQKTGKGLPLHAPCIFRHPFGAKCLIEVICLFTPMREEFRSTRKRSAVPVY
jgi:hypothetical protein